MADALVPGGPSPIDLSPVYEVVLDHLGEGHEEVAKDLTVAVCHALANELIDQPVKGTTRNKVHRVYVAKCLRNSVKEWLEWGLPAGGHSA